MQDISTPLLGRRRLENESNQASSHNLVNRSHRDLDDDVSTRDTEEEEEDDGLLRTDYGSAVYRYPAYLQPGHFTSLEKLMFFTSSILLILLCVFAGLYARSSQQDNAPPLPTPIPKIPKNHTKKETSCLEPNCIITAAQILQDVDGELDPCDDFYAYACNKWEESHAIPDAKSTIDVPSLLTGTIRRRLNQILSRDFDSFFKTNGFLLPDPNTILDRQLFNKLQDFYTSCMDQDTIEQKSITPLYSLFRAIREYIPLNNNMQDGFNTAIQYLAERNIWPLFQLKVEPDVISDPSKPTLYLYGGQVGLKDKEMYNDLEVMRVYMQVVAAILEIIFKKDKSNEFGWKSWSSIATARRIIEFEKKIASSQDHLQPERWTMDQLQERVPQIDWTQFVKDLPEPPTHMLVSHPSFVDHLNEVVLSDMNARTLQMYFIWRAIWTHVGVLGEEFAVQKRKLDAKTSGVEQRALPERWETCIDMLDDSAMGVLLGRYFVADHHRRDIVKAKQLVEDLARQVVSVIEKRVPHLPWIDKEGTVQQQILKKLQSIQFQVGFSTSKPDIRSVISLSEYFGDVTMDKGDFFGNMIKSNQHQVRQQLWGSLQAKTFINTWNAQNVKVNYNKELNKVMIPGGLLQAPFMDTEGPAHFYYGTIGWMIGHEITHAFDKVGRQYNPQGIFGSWWDKQTIQNLDSQNQCLVSQYEAFGIDGKMTLDNNFADLGGLSILESLLFSSKNEVIILPGLKGWTKDQLAYIQFARMKCSKSTKEHKKLNKYYAPDRLRVNGPLINSDHFSSAFGCKVGSFMNPDVKKCQVW